MSFPWAQHYAPKHPLMQWVDSRLPLPRFVYNAIGGGYPVPRNLNSVSYTHLTLPTKRIV